ncbi:O-antigen ligase family protein [Xanthomonas arboricola]|uniref:O-antigen ligase n=4 Tax=Xanthomonas arboricola pv. pruni TaxID=69929 RepID=A0AAP4NLW2_9XANT|nr:O-antigen ligase [Xanthomonas arboricola]KCX01070.1 polymerase [Xanthomonas arboricola pv. pruni]KPN12387.1 polymerase [Xanthomonas arboricola pv. pruni]MDN0266816.1 O-antigen ligase [Xanthomonas arboricola pv. pruni]MDN0270342.1 O-antigen ligase [Xanthomonas arboricola pv. pruni]MDN0274711.1 O-antigen ligase [Xanthomonas arboricola pv. pruni]
MNSLPTQPAALSSSAPIASPAGVGIAELGVFALTALVVSMPSGLLPFGLCLLLGSLVGWRSLRAGVAMRPWSLRALGWLAAAVIAMSLLSIVLFEHGLRDVDNRSRFLVLPWAAVWAYALQPRQVWLWRGALAGVFAAMLIAMLQVMNGADRAEGWTNAIVFADIALMLLVVAVFCRPPGKVRWLVGAAIGTVVVIVLSGSRGVWLSLLVTLGVLIWGAPWQSARMRLLTFVGSAVLAVGVVLSVPALTQQMRLGELQSDLQRYEVGDSDSSAGARIERLHVAWDTLRAHPLTGIGVGRFDDAMRELPVCAGDTWLLRCHLGHAHNDLAEWGATQGVPGLLLLFAVYGVPLWIFVRLHRRTGQRQFRGPAAAGVMIVVSYALCGLTQSMFAHQVSASFYTAMVGVLVGLAARQAQELPARAADKA